MTKVIFRLSVVLLYSFGSVAYAHVPEEGYGTGPWMMHWGHWGGWWIFPFGMFVVMMIFIFFFWGRRGGRSPWCGFDGHRDKETPMDILKKRYAQGEISKEEFEEMKKDL
jgi:putative membrane protein